MNRAVHRSAKVEHDGKVLQSVGHSEVGSLRLRSWVPVEISYTTKGLEVLFNRKRILMGVALANFELREPQKPECAWKAILCEPVGGV